jgi:polar amino acid transport system permease protein
VPENFWFFVSSLLEGAPVTVVATLGGIVLTIVLSLVAGLALLSRSRAVRAVSRTYVELWRGTSEVVQLFWIAFVLPVLVGIQFVPLAAGILVLGLNHGAYGAEIVRGAVQSVPKAQYEGAVALNLTPAQRMRRVILPQAFVEMLPPFNNLFIQLLKGSALLTLIDVADLTNIGTERLEVAFGRQSLLIYSIMLVMYLVLAVLITLGMRLLERGAAARLGRGPSTQARLDVAKAGPMGGVG